MNITIRFQNEPEGIIDETNIQRIFRNPVKIVGASEGFFAVTKDPLYPSHLVLSITCPEKIIQESGKKTRIRMQWEKVESATLSYKVMFPKDVNFVRGGKLPGFGGGTAPRGGQKSDGSDGFSARIMWRERGEIFQYVYWMERAPEKNWGDDLPWTDIGGDKKPLAFVPGKWHTVKTKIVMNTPGKQDGEILSWLDDRPALQATGAFRALGADFGIDQILFTTFFGGNDVSWAPEKDEAILFDDIQIQCE